MKYCMLILSALLCNCSPYLPTSLDNKPNDTILIVVECKSERQIESSALLALRTYRFNDLEKQNDGITIFLKARYQQLADYQASEIKQKLDIMPGVWDVQLIRDGVPVKHIAQIRTDFR